LEVGWCAYNLKKTIGSRRFYSQFKENPLEVGCSAHNLKKTLEVGCSTHNLKKNTNFSTVDYHTIAFSI